VVIGGCRIFSKTCAPPPSCSHSEQTLSGTSMESVCIHLGIKYYPILVLFILIRYYQIYHPILAILIY